MVSAVLQLLALRSFPLASHQLREPGPLISHNGRSLQECVMAPKKILKPFTEPNNLTGLSHHCKGESKLPNSLREES